MTKLFLFLFMFMPGSRRGGGGIFYDLGLEKRAVLVPYMYYKNMQVQNGLDELNAQTPFRLLTDLIMAHARTCLFMAMSVLLVVPCHCYPARLTSNCGLEISEGGQAMVSA
jgi:hypothetical protein